MTLYLRLLIALSAVLFISGCGGGDDHDDHDHGDEHDGDNNAEHKDGDDHGQVNKLPDTEVGGVTVQLQQAKGPLHAGKESILLVTLPNDDKGETIVRAWIGSADRTLSRVGEGHYVADEKHYDVHAQAPDPLPADAMWWVEVEKPDGTKAVGSAKPITE